jgi:hypothetical protein
MGRMSPRGVLLLAIAAAVMCFVVPPAGMAVGILATVLAVRGMRRTAPVEQTFVGAFGEQVTVPVAQKGRGLAVTGLVIAIGAAVLGTLLTVALALFWDEVGDYVDCRDQANTIQAKQKCEDDFRDAVLG